MLEFIETVPVSRPLTVSVLNTEPNRLRFQVCLILSSLPNSLFPKDTTTSLTLVLCLNTNRSFVWCLKPLTIVHNPSLSVVVTANSVPKEDPLTTMTIILCHQSSSSVRVRFLSPALNPFVSDSATTLHHPHRSTRSLSWALSPRILG